MNKMTFQLADRESVMLLRAIVSFEAKMRGCSIGKACADLAREAVDEGSYPDELLERIAELDEAARRNAVAKAMKA